MKANGVDSGIKVAFTAKFAHAAVIKIASICRHTKTPAITSKTSYPAVTSYPDNNLTRSGNEKWQVKKSVRCTRQWTMDMLWIALLLKSK